MTNFDKIKQMSADEFIIETNKKYENICASHITCKNCPFSNTMTGSKTRDCFMVFLKQWLESEVEDDTV